MLQPAPRAALGDTVADMLRRAILEGKATNFLVQPKDIIFVSERPWIFAEELLDDRRDDLQAAAGRGEAVSGAHRRAGRLPDRHDLDRVQARRNDHSAQSAQVFPPSPAHLTSAGSVAR